ncbi:hypothetical protein NPIL_515771 [Nephila pilipes]|uniref:Uncharacterized protein n=1 Tax=Nephila pilipes TaxID=299642 RepID=A0A8X6TC21_NEPPI|nr:hypothetical protein NPIL_515771 [Nephila pilipes]
MDDPPNSRDDTHNGSGSFVNLSDEPGSLVGDTPYLEVWTIQDYLERHQRRGKPPFDLSPLRSQDMIPKICSQMVPSGREGLCPVLRY